MTQRQRQITELLAKVTALRQEIRQEINKGNRTLALATQAFPDKKN